MTIRALIFDIGGVLVRTEDRRPRGEYARRLGLTYQELDELVFNGGTSAQAAVGAVSAEQHWEGVLAELNLPAEELPNLQSAFWGGDRLDTELVKYIQTLRPRYRTALLSNGWSHLRQWIENTWKIAEAFDEVLISAEVGAAKPDPRVYHLALERLGVSPAEALFIDDFIENVEGARAVGMHAILFRSPAQMREEMEREIGEV
jgi:epoxide hydrolase-like predicted phosphatase